MESLDVVVFKGGKALFLYLFVKHDCFSEISSHSSPRPVALAIFPLPGCRAAPMAWLQPQEIENITRQVPLQCQACEL